jgi:hypothetical protein
MVLDALELELLNGDDEGLSVFNNSWLKLVHCILWRLKEVDTWVLHRIIYELNREGLIETNNWLWYGDWPRSAEVDAALALFELLNVVERSDGVIRIRRKPVIECRLDKRVEEVIARVVKRMERVRRAGHATS